MKTCHSSSQNTKLTSSMSQSQNTSSKVLSASSALYDSNSMAAISEKSISSIIDSELQANSTINNSHSSEKFCSRESFSSINSDSSLNTSSISTASSKSKPSSRNIAPGPSSAVCKTKWYALPFFVNIYASL